MTTPKQKAALWTILAVGALGAVLATGLLRERRSTPEVAGPTSVVPTVTQSAGDNSTQIGSVAGDVTIQYGEVDADGRRRVAPNLLRRIAPGNSLAFAASLLGVPILNSRDHRVYELSGYRVLLGGVDLATDSYESVEVAPLNSQTQGSLNLSGDWGQIDKDFGTLTMGAIDAAYDRCYVSDWNAGANGTCHNVVEIECGGFQYMGSYYIRAGYLQACGLLEFPGEHVPTVGDVRAEFLAWLAQRDGAKSAVTDAQIEQDASEQFPKIASFSGHRVNYFTVTRQPRDEPRGARGY